MQNYYKKPTPTNFAPMSKSIAKELIPVIQKLNLEGIKVYCYQSKNDNGKSSFMDNEYSSLYWFDNKTKRVLNLQPSSWRSKQNPDCFYFGVSYVPSQNNGSGCNLHSDNNWGISAMDLFTYRNNPTWVSRIEDYESMDHFIAKNSFWNWVELILDNSENVVV